jgi:hypothetical protein
MLPSVDEAIAVLKEHEEKPEEYYYASEEKDGQGRGFNGYWDDYCLAHFSRGVCLRFIAYPVSFLLIYLILKRRTYSDDDMA